MTQLFGELWFWRQPWPATQKRNVLGLHLCGGNSDPALIPAPSNDKSIPGPSLGPARQFGWFSASIRRVGCEGVAKMPLQAQSAELQRDADGMEFRLDLVLALGCQRSVMHCG